MSASDIVAACRVLLAPGQVTEVRIPDTRYKTISGYFDNLDTLAAEAMAEAIVRAASMAQSLAGVPSARELATVPARMK